MPSNPSRQRIIWVDVGKYFCIMFVMLSHLESNTELLSKFYSPFFLTTFFFLSGYVYMRPLSFRNHIIKKIRGLLIPWLIFSVMDILLSSVISLRNNVDVKSELFWNFLQIRGMGDAIWFVAALFVAYIPFYFLIRIKSPLLVFSISAVCSVISVLYSRYAPAFAYGTNALPWHLEYIFQAILWMVLGYYFRSYWEPAFDKCKTVRRNIIIWALYIIVAYIPTIRGGSIIVPYLRSIIGILAVICLSKWVHTNRYVSFVGQNTLIYFALHGKVYAVIQYCLNRFANKSYSALLSNEYLSSITAVVITLIMSVILIIPAIIINRYFPWMVGRRKNAD